MSENQTPNLNKEELPKITIKRAATQASTTTPPHPSTSIKKVIAVISGKGGVGKSLITSLLAVNMNSHGFKSAILDADITGPSIPRAFGVSGKAVVSSDDAMYPIKSRDGIDLMSINFLLENESDPVLWRGPVISGAVTQFWTDVIWENEDFLFIDMPPGTGDVPLTVFQSMPVDGIIVVTTPQDLVSMIVEKAVKMAEMMKIPILAFVENMSYTVCPKCGEKLSIFGESHLEELAKKYGVDTVCKVPIDPKIAALCDAGKIEDFDENNLHHVVRKLRMIMPPPGCC